MFRLPDASSPESNINPTIQCDGRRTPPRNLLLVYPTIPSMTYWSFSTALKMLGKKSAFPPLGLATIAAMLPESCDLRLIDMNIEPLTDKDLQWADAVLISAMIVQKDSFDEVVKRARRFSIPVIAGGPYPSSAYRELDGVDHFVIGEAENIIHQFWDDFSIGQAKRAYSRPVSKNEMDAVYSFFGDDADIQLVDQYPDINSAPIPRFDLFKQKAYRNMSVQASRGCPIGCEFCDIWRRYGKKPRCKSPQNMTRELDELYRLKWRGPVFIVDDNFIGNKLRAKDILSALTQWQHDHNYPFQLSTEGTLTIADDQELLDGFHNAGFDMVFVGIETPSEESLMETRKHINIKGSIAQKVEKIQRHGLQVTSGFILGFDNDPKDIKEQMIDFIQELGIPVAMVGLLQALPETDLYDRLKREGRLLSKASGNNTHDFQTNFIPKRPMMDVIRDYQAILQSIYPLNLSAYFKRCVKLREKWTAPKYLDFSLRIRWEELRAFISYLVIAPFKSYRWCASKFLISTALRKPSFFVTAVSLGIQGHHFREITRSAFEAFRLADYFSKKREAFSQMMNQYRDSTARSSESLLIEYRRLRDETLAEAKRKYNKLRKDVRETIREEHESFTEEINEMYQQLVFKLTTYSVSSIR